jgi:hypothetical protein
MRILLSRDPSRDPSRLSLYILYIFRRARGRQNPIVDRVEPQRSTQRDQNHNARTRSSENKWHVYTVHTHRPDVTQTRPDETLTKTQPKPPHRGQRHTPIHGCPGLCTLRLIHQTNICGTTLGARATGEAVSCHAACDGTCPKFPPGQLASLLPSVRKLPEKSPRSPAQAPGRRKDPSSHTQETSCCAAACSASLAPRRKLCVACSCVALRRLLPRRSHPPL